MSTKLDPKAGFVLMWGLREKRSEASIILATFNDEERSKALFLRAIKY